ncbi:VanZ family protein [Saccharothrix obliqua]|uniref:VanZ family protein n=1 Tax=Saccharothrix obliqua TaxID=2861747 RepID=UPI001C5F7FDB|nr:VanZ family protein [Saccharothrix obliqua]MBW4717209.1 VanZ family protein [Saccharothrix obliqua]
MIKDWHGLLGTFTGVALLTVAVLPLAVLVTRARARRRRAAGFPPASAWRTSSAEVGIVYGTVPWAWMILLPGAAAGTATGRTSLVPLSDLVTMSTGQVVGNLLVFAALGALVPLRFPAFASTPRIAALAAACSVLLEAAQYALRLDRVSSVDDVLLNTAGAVLAALLSRRWWSPSVDRPLPVPAR